MNLKDQDVLLLVVLTSTSAPPQGYQGLADFTGISLSETHSSIKRLDRSGLVHKGEVGFKAHSQRALEFFLHAIKYLYPPEYGPETRGVATLHHVLPFSEHFPEETPRTVWPDAEGTQRGTALIPIHKYAPSIARNHPQVHQTLALLDALRAGRNRERTLAEKHLSKRLSQP
ncbi:hypothetical protein [Deinococcus cellulosilyticus]|uniref:Uncharacterized protein n=1 Tax=Deinococcus cellulosilyticus (strain DSM 18568 / NBRC 106333 / KACC 11606 / 5516J-15) TaxID=1223518 RepID=A0A511N2C7_DEIC1|nr:hypothetical protein [Deinococcus cellulosilyticus]GEM46657.1 hypothetical protein DC3_22920 [Deinococcus cellulosilyticus NBRC 106333 = KACC 11606]